MSKQMQRPRRPNSVSKEQISSPGVKVALSLKCCPPSTAMSKRWLLRQRAAWFPGAVKDKGGVVELAVLGLWHGAADKPDAVLPRRGGEHLPGRAGPRAPDSR